MSSGLLALLDDVAALAKVAAASVDDVTGMAVKAGAKSAGVVIDDAAVTPRYVVGFAAKRELPIIIRITKGSLRNKLIFLLPAALALSAFAPWMIAPLLMMGGLFLCFEGAEKVLEWLGLHHDSDEAAREEEIGTPKDAEDRRVASAIKTDLILSAEIMAITLAALPPGPLWEQALALAVVAVGITLLVYGAVALIVKADDIGVALAEREGPSLGRRMGRVFGYWLVEAMPTVLHLLSIVGTIAMLFVGGGIVLHGSEELGFGALAHLLHGWAVAVGHAMPVAHGLAEWLASAVMSAILGFGLGLMLVPVVAYVLAPLAGRIKGRKSAH
ncbi:MAG: DUF808 domain-containing protein [Qingshengfaniella sp.]